MAMKSVLVRKAVNTMACIGRIDLRYMKSKIVFPRDISLKHNAKGTTPINAMKLKHKLTLELKYGEIIFTEMKIIETFTNTNKYLNESAEKPKLFHLSNAVGQTNRKQASSSIRMESATHHFWICLPVLKKINCSF